jgi:hypothetical protein
MRDPALVKVHIDLPNHWGTGGESMWARDLGGGLFELQNVPFYAYGLSLNDVVRAVSPDPTLKAEVQELVRPSGHHTLRVVFTNGSSVEAQSLVLDPLTKLGVTFERASPKYLALDVSPEGRYEAACEALAKLEAEGILEYETCEARPSGGFDASPEEGV